jgi:hypothetical protein
MTREVCLCIPDIHVGFVGSEPTHDTLAMKAALDMAREIKPSEVVLLGDALDLAGWSTKFLVAPEDRGRTMQAMTILRDWLLQLRQIVGDSVPIIYLEGNHEARIQKYLLALAPEALNLTLVGSSQPVLSVPALMRLDAPELNVEYVGPYGRSYQLWGRDGVDCSHGSLVRSQGGQSVAAMLQARPWSTVFGHVHRAELASRTLHTPEGPRVIWSMSPGTLARLDGIVPGAMTPNWSQACGIVRRDRWMPDVSMHLIPIVQGKYRLRADF